MWLLRPICWLRGHAYRLVHGWRDRKAFYRCALCGRRS